MEKEIWKDIKEYEGLYQVSNYGRVRSLDRIVKDTTKNRVQHLKGKMLKLTTHKRGYKTIMLHKDNNVMLLLVHRIVAETYIPNPNNLPQVNHKDENKENNCVDNLEWCDNWYNSHYGTRLERCQQHQKTRKIIQCDEYGNYIREWNSIVEAERELNVKNISSVCRGIYKQTKGYYFKYIEKREEN